MAYAGLADDVFDIAVTPDRGYALSVRGVARELATSYGVPLTDPADAGLPDGVDVVTAEVYPASIDDPTACDRFVLREVRGFDAGRAGPAVDARAAGTVPGCAASRWRWTSPTT